MPTDPKPSKLLKLKTTPAEEGADPASITINVSQVVVVEADPTDENQTLITLPTGRIITVLGAYAGINGVIMARAAS